jgi:hypothetical protein
VCSTVWDQWTWSFYFSSDNGASVNFNPPAAVEGNIANWGLAAFQASDAYESIGFEGGALVGLGDRMKPTATIAGVTPGAWVDQATAQITGWDTGLGVNTVSASSDTGDPVTMQGACGAPALGATPCPSSVGPVPLPTSAMPEGARTISATTIDAVNNASPPTSWTVKVDRTPPSGPVLSGSLWDHRNQAADHRNEGLYDPVYTLNASASDARSGLKSIDVQVDSNPPYHYVAACSGIDGCSGSIPPWTFNSDAYTDGDHTVTVTAKDQLADQPGVDNSRHVSTATFQVTVDRRGDIYSASEYDGAPQSGAAKLADEWARAGTHDARSTDHDFVTTRGTAPCDPNQPTSAQCGEVRTKSRFSEPSNSSTADSWVIYRGTNADDPNLDSVAQLQEAAASNLGAPTSTGAITGAAQPWQTLPPAHGGLYSYYESTYQEDVNSDGTNEQIIGRLWIDATTKFPIRMQSQISGGAVTDDRYFNYARGRATSSEVPPDLFLASPPRLVDESKTVTFTGNATQGPQTDAETSASFTSYYLGAAPSLGAGTFCLTTADVVKEGALPPDPNEIPPDPEGSGNLNGPITYTRAMYDAQATGATCSPGTGQLDTPPLSVQSIAGSSSYAAAIRDQFQETAQYIETMPTDEDYFRSGVRSTVLGMTPIVAYIIKVDDQLSSAQMDINGTSVVITGPFDKNNVDQIISQLRTR